MGSRQAMEYTAKTEVRVEFYTRSYHVSGDVEVNRWRLADVLNDQTHPFVLIQNAVREPLPELAQAGGAELARAAQYIQLLKESVVFAIPHEAPQLEAARQQYLSTLYSERKPVGAIAIAPPFEVRGMVHLRRLVGPRQALEDLPAEFLPLTHVEAAYLRDSRLKVVADLAVVNRPLAELFLLTGEGLREGSHGFRTAEHPVVEQPPS